MRIKLYLWLIALLAGFLLYAVFFMKSDYDTGDKLSPNVHIKKIDQANHRIVEYIPEYLPQPIPEIVLKSAKEYDYFYYLFIDKNKKSVLYEYKKGSFSPSDSESFHKEIDLYLKNVRNDGNYKNKFSTADGVKIYEKRVLKSIKAANYVPQKGDSKLLINKMEKEKEKLKAVKDFYTSCAKTFCIINNQTNEYVILDKRDLSKAKKLLDDYKLW